MVRLRLLGNQLVLEGNGESELFGWEHQLFFTISVGYEPDHSRHRYVLSQRAETRDVLLETVDYLQDEGIDYEVDASVGNLLRQFDREDAEFQEAAQAGLETKSSARIGVAAPGFVRQLKSHQLGAVDHLLAVGHGANFSVPGSGKTSVVYAAFEILRQQGVVEKLLVVGPRSSFFPWEDEFRACFGYPVASARLTGPRTSRHAFYLDSQRYTLFLCTYQMSANDTDELVDLCHRHRMLMVVDESHNVKKLEGGVWSQAVVRIGQYAARRVVLSGTPMPNSYADLWTQFTFLWPGKQVLGDRPTYRHRSENEAEHAAIRRAIRPFFVRVTKSDLRLPPFEVERIPCELKPYQSSIYRALSVKFLRQLEAAPEDRQVLRQWRKARMVRLIQAASNPALLARYSEEFDIPPVSGAGASVVQLVDEYPRYEIPAKFEVAAQLVRELLTGGKKVVLWTTFVHNIRMLQRLLQDLKPYIVYGAVPRDEREDTEFNREQQIREFKEVSRPAVLLANPAACAESISLHKACHHALYLDRTFNCGQYMQSLDRIHRIGLAPDEVVQYHILIASGTIDETIDRRLDEKQASMIRLLEDELPVGTLEVEAHQIGYSESEEAIDFKETIKDARQQLEGTESTTAAQ